MSRGGGDKATKNGQRDVAGFGRKNGAGRRSRRFLGKGEDGDRWSCAGWQVEILMDERNKNCWKLQISK